MFPILADFLATLRGRGLKDGPVRQGQKSKPAEGLQGRSVRGRVDQWQDGPVRERQLHSVALCTYITTS
jgi:hypothetical protein